jgi:phenylalanyl-tRNA synthetase beta chain
VKASYRWLRALLPELTRPAHEVATSLARAGFRVASISESSSGDPTASDFVFELDPSDERAQVRGHVGLARELAAELGLRFDPPGPSAPPRVSPTPIGSRFTALVSSTQRCPLYGAALVVDVKPSPSPAWLARRLRSLGEPIACNIVDAATLVRLEFGHPIAVYDLERIVGSRVEVREARDGETLQIDAATAVELGPEDAVVADDAGVLALAGILPAERASIQAATRHVLVECAWFDAASVRASAIRHELETDSATRFAHGVDPTVIPDVLAHAAAVITELSGGAGAPGTLLVGSPANPS